jgi:hypothetical protein
MRDRDPFGDFLQPADVIDVVMRQHEVVDLLDAGLAEHLHDPPGIPLAGIAGVDQQRLA